VKKLTAKKLLLEVREIKKQAAIYLESDVKEALLKDGISESDVKEILSIMYNTLKGFPSGSTQKAFNKFLGKAREYGFSPSNRSFRVVQQYFAMIS
tara:strand:- start:140 stop:427 length:288 start_codon:yes stop_codon:yes gene_type:complete